ncbi:MAG: TonB-dependent receptor plug domain-containing protein [Bacteroidota bacterium]
MRFLHLLILAVFLVGCSPLNKTTTANKEDRPSANVDPNQIEEPSMELRDLSEYLRRIAGVTVQGAGSNARVFIRGGANNLSGSRQEPLFVVNGTPVNGGFSDLHSWLPVQEIQRVKVIKDQDAAIYGTRGANGVIEITTK